MKKVFASIAAFWTKYSKYLPWIIIGILTIILLFSVKSCNKNKDSAQNWQAKYAYERQVTDSVKNKLGQQVAKQQIVETNDAQYIKQLSDSVFNLTKKEANKVKEVQALIRQVQQLKIANKLIPYDSDNVSKTDTVIDNKDYVQRDSVIIPPRKFSVDDKYYSIHGSVELQGVKVESINIIDTISFRIIESKASIFKSQKLEVQAIHSNPNFSTNSMSSIVLKPKISAWNRWIKPALFAGAAILITSQVK